MGTCEGRQMRRDGPSSAARNAAWLFTPMPGGKEVEGALSRPLGRTDTGNRRCSLGGYCRECSVVRGSKRMVSKPRVRLDAREGSDACVGKIVCRSACLFGLGVHYRGFGLSVFNGRLLVILKGVRKRGVRTKVEYAYTGLAIKWAGEAYRDLPLLT